MTLQPINDIIQWDVKSWSKALSYWDQHTDWGKVENGLELGGREGGLSLWLALKGKQVVCSDLEDVKSKAHPLHIKHNVAAHVQYQDIDATHIPYHNHFDLVVFKSIIGGIGRNDTQGLQQKVFDEIYKALKPGGKLLFAENLIASPLHQHLRNRYVSWGNSWRYVSITEMKGFLKNFKSFDIKSTGVLGALGRTESQRNFLSSVDAMLLNHVCPGHWKYIGYGIAEK